MSGLGFILISFKKCLDTAFQKHINNYDTKKDNIYCWWKSLCWSIHCTFVEIVPHLNDDRLVTAAKAFANLLQEGDNQGKYGQPEKILILCGSTFSLQPVVQWNKQGI